MLGRRRQQTLRSCPAAWEAERSRGRSLREGVHSDQKKAGAMEYEWSPSCPLGLDCSGDSRWPAVAKDRGNPTGVLT